ncbi:MAG: hypothetical protein EBZ49_04615 [Proteobacteria bacterium]|nr:hypothetical protein [Pseudomonadota bacterium]
MVPVLKNERGQSVVEYLLLTLAAAVTAFFILPEFGQFTVQTLEDIRERLGSVAKDGELSQSEKQPGQKGHPSDPERFKALHF